MKRKLTCTTYIILVDCFSRKHTKKRNSTVRAHQDFTFSAVGYHRPESQLAIHIYYVKFENPLICKRIS